MKIYIKTTMAEMPNGCLQCEQLTNCKKREQKINEAYNGGYTFNEIKKDNYSRPYWCPLTTEAEIIQPIVEEITKLINVPLNSVQDALDIIKEHLEGKNEG